MNRVSSQFSQPFGRRGFLAKSAATAAAVPLVVLPNAAVAEVVVPEQVTAYDFPTDWGLTFAYEEDAAKVREHMLIATGLGKGAADMEKF